MEDISIRGARGILINITATPDISMEELKEICGIIQEEAHDDAIIKWGLVYDDSLNEEIRVTVIATGIGKRLEVPADLGSWPQAQPAQPEDLEIPTILRQTSEPAARTAEGRHEPGAAGGVAALADQDLLALENASTSHLPVVPLSVSARRMRCVSDPCPGRRPPG